MERRVRVVIADDQKGARQSLRAFLSSVCLHEANGDESRVEVVAEAKDGQQVLELVCRFQPDVVVMDVCMPDMDGLAATQLIKRRFPHIRVIILTFLTAYRAKARAEGADSFLVKGCPADDLVNAVLATPSRQTV